MSDRQGCKPYKKTKQRSKKLFFEKNFSELVRLTFKVRLHEKKMLEIIEF